MPTFNRGSIKFQGQFGVSLDGFHKSLNSMKSPEDSRISIGDILGDILRNYLQDNLREVSGNLRTSEICENG